MKTTLRGKIYLLIGLIFAFIAYFEPFGVGREYASIYIAAAFASGVAISWSYWLWWRNIIWKKKLKREE